MLTDSFCPAGGTNRDALLFHYPTLTICSWVDPIFEPLHDGCRAVRLNNDTMQSRQRAKTGLFDRGSAFDHLRAKGDARIRSTYWFATEECPYGGIRNMLRSVPAD